MTKSTGKTRGPRWYWHSHEDEQAFLKSQRDSRTKELKGVLVSLRRLYNDEVAATSKYLPIRFLSDGVDAYLNAFDNATIYYAGLAVELALMTRLGDKGLLGNRAPIFADLIGLASKNRILTKTGTERAHRIRKIRNAYMHYYNVARLSAVSHARSPKSIERSATEVAKFLGEHVPVEEQPAL